MLLIASCKKGDTGPAGPAGAAGPAGPAGAAGPKGDTGTANVIYSGWLDVTFRPVKDSATGDTLAWVGSISAPKITNTILTTGTVKVYLNAGTAAQPVVFTLPITDLFALTGVLNLNVYFTQGTINMYSTEDASTFTDQGQKVWQYRYVIIPGGVSARTGNTINWNNYAEVKAYLGWKD
jgi:hypothetical protein